MSLKDFTILSLLGEGAYSTVYKVERLADKQIYALKKVSLTGLSEKEIENALNEVRILASLRNDYIVSYKQAFVENRTLCSSRSIVMEFADNGDLYQRIVEKKSKNQLFEEREIWSVLIQSVIALKNLHALNILHRDLKSANIFLNQNGQAKLGDLNVSKVAKNGLLYTQTGTPYYASPEVWKDEPYDLKSDIWSLGCVLYEMAALEPPFQAEDMEGLFKAVTEGTYQPIPTKYSKELSHIIKLMLQQKPRARPSADKIISSAMIQKKIEEIGLEKIKSNQPANSELLKTIRIPRMLHYLTDRLPKPNYDNDSEERKPNSLKNSPSLPQKDKSKNNQGSLPKLNQILMPSIQGDRLKAEKGRRKKISGAALMIEGQSKIIQEAKSQEKQGEHLEKEIRDKLRKIYKARVGRSEDQKIKRTGERSLILPPIRL